MFGTVIVPLDGSDLSERAVPYGRALADAAEAQLILVRVVPPRTFPDDDRADTQDHDIADAGDYLSQFADPDVGGKPVEALAFGEDPATILVETARARPTSIIVMSTHGRSGVGELVFGSVAEAVVRRAERPVVVIPPDCDVGALSSSSGRVLACLDGSERSEAILPAAIDVARALGRELVALRVVAPVSYVHIEGYDEPVAVPTEGISAADAEAYLEDVASEIREEGQRVSIYVADSPNVASEILYAAKDKDASIIAIATHGRGGLAEILLGSIASAVVRESKVPVLLLRPVGLT
jgi:nucleotide-binding universal stress UspA family protein